MNTERTNGFCWRRLKKNPRGLAVTVRMRTTLLRQAAIDSAADWRFDLFFTNQKFSRRVSSSLACARTFCSLICLTDIRNDPQSTRMYIPFCVIVVSSEVVRRLATRIRGRFSLPKLARTKIPWLAMIICVTGVLTRTVVDDWRFNNLCGSEKSLDSNLTLDWHLTLQSHLTLKMASALVVEISVANNSPF